MLFSTQPQYSNLPLSITAKKKDLFLPWSNLQSQAGLLTNSLIDVFILTQEFGSERSIHDMSSFKLLVRLFKEQCIVADDKTGSTEPKAVARPNKDVPSDSLQNPSDPDAGYSNHKGQGYQVQVVENYTEGADKHFSLITHVAVESADKHDAGSLLPALEKLKQQEMSPQQTPRRFALWQRQQLRASTERALCYCDCPGYAWQSEENAPCRFYHQRPGLDYFLSSRSCPEQGEKNINRLQCILYTKCLLQLSCI